MPRRGRSATSSTSTCRVATTTTKTERDFWHFFCLPSPSLQSSFLRKAKLKTVTSIAAVLGFESGWQHIGRQHKAQLVEQILDVCRQAKLFHRSVLKARAKSLSKRKALIFQEAVKLAKQLNLGPNGQSETDRGNTTTTTTTTSNRSSSTATSSATRRRKSGNSKRTFTEAASTNDDAGVIVIDGDDDDDDDDDADSPVSPRRAALNRKRRARQNQRRVAQQRQQQRKQAAQQLKRWVQNCLENEAETDCASPCVQLKHTLNRAFDAAVHLFPSGSGSVIDVSQPLAINGTRKLKGKGKGKYRHLILTCAHCVDHDDDNDEEEEDEQEEEQTVNLTSTRPKPRSTSNDVITLLSDSECDDNDDDDDDDARTTTVNRVGRYKIAMWADGRVALVKCVTSLEKTDCALLSVVLQATDQFQGQTLEKMIPNPHEIATITLATEPPLPDTRVACIHNPYDWNLEVR